MDIFIGSAKVGFDHKLASTLEEYIQTLPTECQEAFFSRWARVKPGGNMRSRPTWNTTKFVMWLWKKYEIPLYPVLEANRVELDTGYPRWTMDVLNTRYSHVFSRWPFSECVKNKRKILFYEESFALNIELS